MAIRGWRIIEEGQTQQRELGWGKSIVLWAIYRALKDSVHQRLKEELDLARTWTLARSFSRFAESFGRAGFCKVGKTGSST